MEIADRIIDYLKHTYQPEAKDLQKLLIAPFDINLGYSV
jgi:hypothetical protein